MLILRARDIAHIYNLAGLPDFSHYTQLRTIDKKELDFDNKDRRVIFVGDIHGKKDALEYVLQNKWASPLQLLIKEQQAFKEDKV